MVKLIFFLNKSYLLSHMFQTGLTRFYIFQGFHGSDLHLFVFNDPYLILYTF